MKSLQEEIQQRKWQNDQQLALVNVLFTYHWLKEHCTFRSRDSDMTYRKPGHSIRELCSYNE